MKARVPQLFLTDAEEILSFVWYSSILRHLVHQHPFHSQFRSFSIDSLYAAFYMGVFPQLAHVDLFLYCPSHILSNQVRQSKPSVAAFLLHANNYSGTELPPASSFDI